MADMKSQMDLYQQELENLRGQVAAYENVETSVETPSNVSTSRRKLLKRMAIAGIGGLGALGLAAAASPNPTVLAATASNNAIEGIGGDDGYGVQASSSGLAPLRLIPSGGGATPVAGRHEVGELWVDSAGSIFYCITATTTKPTAPNGDANWRQLAGAATAGSLHYLNVPDRFGDTRSSSTIGGKNTPFAANTSFDYTISGATGRDGTHLPTGIVGVVGNVTAINATTGGLLKVLPGGTSSTIGTSVVNFGTNIAFNSFNVRLSADGKLRIAFGGSGTVDVFFDIVGYYL